MIRPGSRPMWLWLGLWLAAPAIAGTYTHSPETLAWVDPAAHTDVVWTAMPGGPANECTSTSAAGDDDITQALALGFTYNFGGTAYNSVRIMSNGRLQFNNTFCGYGTQVNVVPRIYPYPMPDTRLLRVMRAYGADLDPTAGGSVRYASLGSAPNRSFVVTWSNVPEWSAVGSSFNVQVVLHENGDFVYQYGSMTNPQQGIAQIGWEVSTDDYQLMDYVNATALQNSARRFSAHTPTPLLYYPMDEMAWNGTPNEVADLSGNNNHGDGVGTVTTLNSGYQCRGGDFSDNSAAVDTKQDVRDQIGIKGTITFWLNNNSNWNSGNRMILDGSANNGNGNADKYFFTVKRNNGALRFRLEDSNDADLQAETSGNSFTAGSWHHVAITWDISHEADWLQVYIDGTRRATSRGNLNAPLTISGLFGNLNSLYLGKNRSNGIGGNGYSNSSVRGVLDESRVYTEVLSGAQIVTDMNKTHGCIVMELHMDETAWDGTVEEVTDSSGFGNAGTSFNGLNTSVGYLCNGGNFDGVDDYIQVPHNTLLDGTDALTYAAWIKPNAWTGIDQVIAKSVHGGGTGRSQMGIFSEGGVLKGRVETAAGRYEVSTALPAIGAWTHVALVFNGVSLTLYINGVSAVTQLFASTSLVNTTDALLISKRYPDATYFFDGMIDEMLVFRQAISAADVAQIVTNYQNGLNWDGALRVCPGVPLDHIEIRHDGNALTCNPESVTLRACATADCSTLYTSDVSATLLPTGWVGGDTQTIINGSSVFQFRRTPPGVASLGINSSSPAAVNPSVCLNTSDNSASCDLTFHDTGFVYSLPTQVSCQPSATITVAAVRKDDVTQQCIPAFANRNETINFWSRYLNPVSGTRQLTLNNGSTNYLLATASPGTGVPLSFNANAEATISVTYPDAGQLSLNSRFEGSGNEANLVMTGSATFANKPAKLYVYSDDLNADCVAGDLSCSRYRQSGQVFNLKVRAACADNSVTPNFQHNPLTLSHSLFAPAGGAVGNLGVSSAVIAAGDNGEVTITNQTVSEVGVFRFSAQLTGGSNYFGETSVGDAASNISVNIGRFNPAWFEATRIHGCNAGVFTYSAQPFTAIATAYNTFSAVTQNYDGGLGFAQPTTISDVGDSSNFSNNVIANTNFSAGVGSRTDVTYTFPIVNTAPATINLRTIDVDAVSSSGQLEQSTDIHGGRIAIANAFGSELIDLSVSTTVQHYDGSNFVTFSSDTCSTLSLILSKVDGSLNLANGGTAGDTCIWDDAGDSGANNCTAASVLPGPVGSQYTEPPVAGSFNLYLKAPGAGFTGNVDVTGNVDNWLQFDWRGAGVTNPVGRATFGIYRGDDRIIYWREKFE